VLTEECRRADKPSSLASARASRLEYQYSGAQASSSGGPGPNSLKHIRHMERLKARTLKRMQDLQAGAGPEVPPTEPLPGPPEARAKFEVNTKSDTRLTAASTLTLPAPAPAAPPIDNPPPLADAAAHTTSKSQEQGALLTRARSNPPKKSPGDVEKPALVMSFTL
jgi:hypothetical protein